MAVLDYALTSLDNVKMYLFNSTSGTTYDDLLEMLIDEVTVMIEMECGDRRFKNSGDNIEEYYSGVEGGKIVFPKAWPIEEVIGVEVNSGTQGNPTWEPIDTDTYSVDYNSGMIYIGTKFSIGIGNYKVVYKGGYDEIPKDIEMAAIKMVAKEFDKRRSQGIVSEGGGGNNASWNENVDPSAERIFQKYRRF